MTYHLQTTGSLDSDALLSLERAIDDWPFAGMPLGAVLNDSLLVDFRQRVYQNAFDIQLAASARHTTRLFRHVLGRLATPASLWPGRARRSLPAQAPANGLLNDKVLCTRLVNNNRCRDLMVPVIRAFGPDRAVVLGAAATSDDDLPGFSQYISVDSVAFSTRSWAARYGKLAPHWLAVLTKHCCRLGLPLWALSQLMDVLVLASQQALGALFWLRRTRPKAIICEFDRHRRTAPWMLAAKRIGIPTYTLQHGMINLAYGYLPLVADKILVWGKDSDRTLRGFGLPNARVEVVGHPGLYHEPLPDARQVCAELNLDPEKPVVLLATSPLPNNDRHALTQGFCDAMKVLPAYQAVVRLHPSETLSHYEALMRQNRHVCFLDNRRITNLQALSLVSVVVGHNTGFGLETLLYSKPLIIFDCLEEPLLGAGHVANKAGCPVAKTSLQLGELVAGLVTDKQVRARHLEHAANYIDSVFHAYGAQAAQRVVDAITSDLER